MTPSNPSSAAAIAPLPPGPDMSGAQTGASPAGPPGLEMMISGLAPVKGGVDQILAGAKAIVQSGAIPGAEQICGQIVALATQLLPMAVQQVTQPGGMGGGAPSAPPPGPFSLGGM